MNHVSDTIASNREKSLRNGQVLNRPQNGDFEQTGITPQSSQLGNNPADQRSDLASKFPQNGCLFGNYDPPQIKLAPGCNGMLALSATTICCH